MKFLYSVLAVLCLGLSVEAQTVGRISNFQALEDGSVEDKPSSWGTVFCVGVFEDVSVWMTNGHVVEDGKKFTVLIDGTEYELLLHKQVRDYDAQPEVDLAVLLGSNVPCTACKIAEKDLEEGDQAYTRSHPAGAVTQYSFALEALQWESRMYVPYGATVPGCSGSPVFNTDGEVVGVVWAFVPGGHVSYRCVLRDVLDILGGLGGGGDKDEMPYMPGMYMEQELAKIRVAEIEKQLEKTKRAQDVHVVLFVLGFVGLALFRKKSQ